MILIYRRFKDGNKSAGDSGFKGLKECISAWTAKTNPWGDIDNIIEYIMYEDTETGEFIQAFPDVKTLSVKEIMYIKLSH